MAKGNVFDDDFDFSEVPDTESGKKSKVCKLEEECGKFAKKCTKII